MPGYHPQAELAPRDVVSRAIVDQIRDARADCVYLDVSHLPAALLKRRFPSIRSILADYGLDLLHDLIPIRPAAHYMMGGIKTGLEGRSTLPGLYACGEAACTGLHGANRLASNSLLEGLVYGERAGAAAAREIRRGRVPRLENRQPRKRLARLDIEDVRRSLKSLLWQFAGIERRAEDLEEAMRRILFWKKYVLGVQFPSSSGWVLQNMLITAEWIVEGALQRKESRGGHFRLDYPRRDDRHWKKHITFQKPR
jgi:L-aspartate oxidase